MLRQTLTTGALAIALVGAGLLAGCQSEQRPVRSSQVRADQNRRAQMERSPQPAAIADPAGEPGPSVICSTMHYPTGDPATSTIKLEKCVPAQARQGEPFSYDITVTNRSRNELIGVVVTDRPEGGMRITGSAPAGKVTGSGLHTWSLGTMAPNETRTITIEALSRGQGTISSCAAVLYESWLCTSIPVVAPKLRLATTGPASALACDDIIYQFEVTNIGTGTVTGVTITDELPVGLTASDGSDRITFDAGALAAGQSKRFTGRARASGTGRFENRATASGSGLTAESGTVVTAVRQPVLAVTNACPRNQYIGKSIAYEIAVTNTGDGDSRDTVVEATLAGGLEFESASDGGRLAGGRVTWNIGTLAAKATKYVTMQALPRGNGTFGSTVTARGHCAAAASDSCETVVTGIPGMLLEVVDVEDPVRVGEVETYVITVTNQGTAADTNIVITASLESYQEYDSSYGPTTGTARGNVVTFAPLRSLGAKEQAVYRVKARSVRAGDVRFKVSMNSDQLTRPVEETESTHIYE
ncbi:MAG: hypothetical protein ACYTGP_06400 [Planctomycetota bacterium]|jgi:uncharacterized repeat protein (TIGR01451 family)